MKAWIWPMGFADPGPHWAFKSNYRQWSIQFISSRVWSAPGSLPACVTYPSVPLLFDLSLPEDFLDESRLRFHPTSGTSTLNSPYNQCIPYCVLTIDWYTSRWFLGHSPCPGEVHGLSGRRMHTRIIKNFNRAVNKAQEMLQLISESRKAFQKR